VKGRYQLRHDRYGFGLKYTKLEHAQRELQHCVPAGEWFIFDRETKTKV
jgi:hypothetical protein